MKVLDVPHLLENPVSLKWLVLQSKEEGFPLPPPPGAGLLQGMASLKESRKPVLLTKFSFSRVWGLT